MKEQSRKKTSQDIIAEVLFTSYSTLTDIFATYKQGKYTGRNLHMFFIAGLMQGALPDEDDGILDARIGDKIRKIMKAYSKRDKKHF